MKKIFLVPFLLFLFLFISPAYSAAHAESLYIRTDKSYVKPGSFYNLSVLINSTKTPFVSDTGLLDVNVTSCNQSGTCNTTTGPWGNHSVQNGSVKLNIATDYAPSYFRARFKPRGSNWDWSNEIQVDVGMTKNLENAQDYWLLYSTPAEYTGYNFADNKNFKTVIGFENSPDAGGDGKFCGETVRTMYFMKDNPSGYWDPHVPWYDWRGDYDEKNLLWHIVPWQTKQSWVDLGYDDEYLTSIGNERYYYNLADPFNLSANFNKERETTKLREEFPNYILSPKWVGNGWGINIGSRSSGAQSPDKSFCDLPINRSGDPGTWIVQADTVNIDLPFYKGPALRYKYYEGPYNCLFDSTKFTLREDWYFVKNKGLVKIEQKYFGPASGIRKPCQEDDDCLMNEIMSSPHIRLVRTDLLATPTPKPGDLDGDGDVDSADFNKIVAEFGHPYTIFDYNVLVGNFGK